ncbi:MAG: type IV pilus assembly protein PilM [Mycobacteriales bacterium]
MAARNVVGLDIGTSGVRAAEVSMGGGKEPLTLHRFGQVGLPLGAVVNGEVIDIDAVAAALRQLWGSVKFSTKKVVIGVANQKVVVRQVDLPWMADKELKKALPFQVADVIPMPLDQAVLDMHPIATLTGDGGAQTRRIMLVAAVRDMVSTTVAAVHKAGLEPVMVDLTPFAVLRANAGTAAGGWAGESEALVDVGASVTNIVVHQSGVPRFVRILPLGGSDITGAVGERMGVGFDEAEMVKQGLSLSDDPAAVPTHPAGRVLEAAANAWVEEVRGSLDYYLAQAGSPRLHRVVLSGGGARLGGLVRRLSLATRLEVIHANPMSSVRVGKTGLTPEQLQYVEPQVVVPLGLALGRAS